MPWVRIVQKVKQLFLGGMTDVENFVFTGTSGVDLDPCNFLATHIMFCWGLKWIIYFSASYLLHVIVPRLRATFALSFDMSLCWTPQMKNCSVPKSNTDGTSLWKYSPVILSNVSWLKVYKIHTDLVLYWNMSLSSQLSRENSQSNDWKRKTDPYFLLNPFDVSGLESDFLKGWKFGRNIHLKQRCILACRRFMWQNWKFIYFVSH
jgi:hypothetical protein